MKISRLIEELKRIEREHGDIEVTCTASTDGDSKSLHPQITGGCFESTVNTLTVKDKDERWKHGKRVRLYW
jgi:hypothetical protein